jgi:hypothetical protein
VMLKEYWKDIKETNNLETYITLIACMLILLLDWLDFFSSPSLKIMAPLGMLFAVSLLQLSIKVDKIKKDIVHDELTTVVHVFPTNFDSLLSRSKRLDISGVHFSSFLTDHGDSVREMLKNGGKLRVLMVPAESSAAEMTAQRFLGGGSVAQENARIRSCRSLVVELKTQYPRFVEFREKDYLFERSLICIDPKKDSGLIVEQRYTFRTSGGSKKPKLLFRMGTEWFKLSYDEFNKHWDSSQEVV